METIFHENFFFWRESQSNSAFSPIWWFVDREWSRDWANMHTQTIQQQQHLLYAAHNSID